MDEQTKQNSVEPENTAADTTNMDHTAADTTNTDVGCTFGGTDTTYTDITNKDADTMGMDTLPNEKTTFTDTDKSNEGKGILYKFRYDAEFRHRFMHTAFVWWGFVTLVGISLKFTRLTYCIVLTNDVIETG